MVVWCGVQLCGDIEATTIRFEGATIAPPGWELIIVGMTIKLEKR